MLSNWSTICQHSHLYCLHAHVIGWGMEMISPENRRSESDGMDRVSSVQCRATGNDGVSAAGVLWLSVIVSGLRLKQGWVTLAPNVNHHRRRVWLNSPRRRDRTVWPRPRARTCAPEPHPQAQFSSDHPGSGTLPPWDFSIKSRAVTTTPQHLKINWTNDWNVLVCSSGLVTAAVTKV